MTAKMKIEDLVMTVTKMGTSFRITTKKRVKDVMPGNRRKGIEVLRVE